MLILTIRTDKPESEIGLYEDTAQVAYISWPAHRQLAETIHIKIFDMLTTNNKNLEDIEGVNAYKGPGSFTGLRIGLAVANAITSSNQVPIVAEGTESWVQVGIERLLRQETDKVALPEYGSPVHITTPKK